MLSTIPGSSIVIHSQVIYDAPSARLMQLFVEEEHYLPPMYLIEQYNSTTLRNTTVVLLVHDTGSSSTVLRFAAVAATAVPCTNTSTGTSTIRLVQR